MAEILINSSSDTGGEAIRYLRSRQREIIDTWMNRIATTPPHRSVGSFEAVREIASLLPLYLTYSIDRAEVGDYSRDPEALKPIAERAAAAGIPISSLERALGVAKDVVEDFLHQALGDRPEALLEALHSIGVEFDDARSEVAQLYLAATLRKLQETDEKYLNFMRNATEALLVCEPKEGAILEANRKAEEISGHKTGALVAMHLNDLEKRHQNVLAAACRKAMADKQLVVLENVELLRKDAAAFTADVRISPLQNEEGMGSSALVAVHDTTFEKELEERMRSFGEQLNRTANEKAEEIAALTRLTSAISSGADLEKVFQVVVFEIGKLIGFDRLSIMLVEDDAQRYRVTVLAGKDARHLVAGSVYPVKGSLVEHAFNQRKPILHDDLAAGANLEEDKLLAQEGIRSYICAPLMTGQKLVGSLLLCSGRPRAFGARDITIMQDIGEQVAVAMQWAKLREMEHRRKAEMSIINEIGREAMSTLNLKTLLKTACAAIQKNFQLTQAGIFLVDWTKGEAELAGSAGDKPQPENVRLKNAAGAIAQALQAGRAAPAAGLQREIAQAAGLPPDATPAGELCVPIKISGHVEALLHVQSKDPNAFDEGTVSALGTLADLVARAIENARLYQRTSTLRELNENIIATMPSALLVLDRNLNVILANSAYCRIMNAQKREVEGKGVRQLWSDDFLKESKLLASLAESLQAGKSFELKNIPHHRDGRQMILNFGISSITTGEQPRVLLIIEDVTETVERAFRLSMLREINQAIQGTLELDRILRLVLTCVTAGHALGFNRGFLLMVDGTRNRVEGTTGIGPVSLDDARRIYSDESLRQKSLKQLLDECDFSVRKEDLPLYHLAKKMVFSLNDNDEIVVKTVKEKKVFTVLDAARDERVSRRFRELIGSNSFVSVPLVAKDEVIGVILADNLYSGHPITQERTEMLAIFANHAGLAVENGESYARLQEEIRVRTQAYERLEEMREREVRTSQLAAVGEMAARVAHEIRNPLVTIGGYARVILKSLGPDDSRRQKAEIIVGEVMRLERILTGVVDFSRPATPNKVMLNLNTIVDQVSELMHSQLSERNISIERLQRGAIPQISADPAQIKQALFNIVKNAMEAIDRDGRIIISTGFDGKLVGVEIIDSGPGIMEDVRDNMYNLFFTTKAGGTGLGLAITRKIIEDHRGFLNVASAIGEGTTFSVFLPVNPESDAGQTPAQAPVQGGPQL